MVDPDVGFALECRLPMTRRVSGTDDEALGTGPAIVVYDRSMIPNRNLLAPGDRSPRRRKSPSPGVHTQGGTDWGRIHLNRAGVPSMVIGVPTRYIHSHIGACCTGAISTMPLC